MAIKTKVTDASVEEFITSVDNKTRREDGFKLLEMFTQITGEQAKMWGPSLIGFGKYHYKSERSRQEGDWPMVGFSPRKQNLSLYVLADFDKQDELLEKLGKHKKGAGCLYINKLEDVDLNVLEEIVRLCWEYMKKKYPDE